MINVAAPSNGRADKDEGATAATQHMQPGTLQQPGTNVVPMNRAATSAAMTQANVQMATWHPVIVAFVKARGKLLVAAEAIGMEAEVYTLELTQHMEELASAVRAIVLLDSFDLAKKTKMVLDLNLEDLKGEELVKLYTATLAQIERLTGGTSITASTTNNYNIGNNNVDAKIVQALPPHAQAALMRLRESSPDILDHIMPQLEAGGSNDRD